MACTCSAACASGARTTGRAGSAERRAIDVRLSVELCSVYWHFLLLVWLVLFARAVVYLREGSVNHDRHHGRAPPACPTACTA